MKFYLGTHHESWLNYVEVPLFVSNRRLMGRKTLPRAKTNWALDSGGFSELSMFGGWQTTEAEYLDDVARYASEIGKMDWAAPMDWMCEPGMLAKTGLTVVEHQHRTVDNYCRLRQAAPLLPFAPVLQGWGLADYLRCIGFYRDAGVDLRTYPVVGIGSVCRRQGTAVIGSLIETIAARGIRLHGFGVKTLGLGRYGQFLVSSDSLAWSYQARRSPPMDGCVGHINCANCLRFALAWRSALLHKLVDRVSLS